MPEETEQTSEQQESSTEGTVDETATTGQGGTEQQDDAQEAETGSEEKPKPKPPPGKSREVFDLERAKEKIRKQNSEAENLRKRLREYEDRDKTEAQKLADQLAAATEQVTKTRQRLARTQVQALAMTGFADPEDAVGALDLDSYIDSDGDIDEAAIKADLDALLERKPHWAKTQPQEGPRRPAPDRTQASGANKKQAPSPRDEFAGWLSSKLT
ncbi:hypothetical protein [Streptomyces sp. NPDC005303]|uniref:hypothetical protein n=1 Tax=Streptomyces sp. NPDC005303 TaxID=3155713 RepID=UPI00339E4EB7